MHGKTIDEMYIGQFAWLKKTVIDGDIKSGSFMAGQIAGVVKEGRTVKEVIEDMFKNINNYKDTLNIL